METEEEWKGLDYIEIGKELERMLRDYQNGLVAQSQLNTPHSHSLHTPSDDKVEYMKRMRNWFMEVRKSEGVFNTEWRYRGRSGTYVTTSNIVKTLNSMIGKYSIGCTMEDVDRDTLNLYREFYNRNRGREFIHLITTI
jgi:hypothetical protein